MGRKIDDFDAAAAYFSCLQLLGAPLLPGNGGSPQKKNSHLSPDLIVQIVQIVRAAKTDVPTSRRARTEWFQQLFRPGIKNNVCVNRRTESNVVIMDECVQGSLPSVN